jgi:ABC-type sugar transport system substrate-binding protein
LDIQANNDDNDLSYEITSSVIRKQKPDLIYFCAAGTEGGVKAVKDSGERIKVIVVDDIPPMRDYLAEGTIQAIITQQPYYQGVNTIETLYKLFTTGKEPENMNNYMENQIKLKHSK